jgi:hypothetical protein
MATLSYYFNSQNVFQYTTEPERLLSGINDTNSNAFAVDVPNNDSSIPVISIKMDEGLPRYYSFNKIYISLTSLFNNQGISNSKYQLILQGNLDNFTTNSSNQIIIIIPIFTSISSTIEGVENSITNMNSNYLDVIFNNMSEDGRQNYLNGVDFNQFLVGTSKANYYSNVIDSGSNPTTVYTIIQFKESNLYQDLKLPSWVLFTVEPSMPTYDADEIITINNGKPITKITQQDIYIDCSPTNNLGQPVDIYTSKNLDQLNMFEINDLKVWAFRIITIFVIILIVFVIIKIFQVDGKPLQVQSSTQP